MTDHGTIEQNLRYRRLDVGEPAPWFVQRSTNNPTFNFHSVGGRFIVLCFFVSARDKLGRDALKIVEERRQAFDDQHLVFFGVSMDPTDESEGRVAESMPGVRYFFDFDGTICRKYGVIPLDTQPADGKAPARRMWVLLDPMMRTRAVIPFRADGSDRQEMARILDSLPPIDGFAGYATQVPVLVVPNVFEPELCRKLIGLYDAQGGEESGFMHEVEGKTVRQFDHKVKRRSDVRIRDQELKSNLKQIIHRRLVPEIHKAYQFRATRMERYIVVCYDSATRGHFRPHRDNTTKGTAHRRFAVSVGLNDDYEGGDLCFREYGPRWFKPPLGGALVFSCSMLHEVSPMVRGKRYAFLPFLYDDAAAAIREANNVHLSDEVGAYTKKR